MMRIDRLLANLKYGTRSEVKDLIRQGRIRIDGNVVTDAGTELNPETAAVDVDGVRLWYRKWITLMMNKPAGVVSANVDAVHPTAIGLLPPPYDRFDLSICGRLDLDAEGLLVLTNDGDLVHRIISPKADVYKLYEVELKETPGDLSSLEKGVLLKESRGETFRTQPAQLERIGERTVRIAIAEGKFHQVKRMFESIGGEVVRLKRIAIGGLALDPALPPGGCRELDAREAALATAGNPWDAIRRIMI